MIETTPEEQPPVSEQDRTTEPTPTRDAADQAVAPETPQTGEPAEQKGRSVAAGKPVTQRLGQMVVIGIAVLFGVFAVVNSQYVDFNWVFGGTEVVEAGGERSGGGVPLIVLLVGAFALGAMLGRATTWRRTRQMKRELRDR